MMRSTSTASFGAVEADRGDPDQRRGNTIRKSRLTSSRAAEWDNVVNTNLRSVFLPMN